MIRYIVGRAGQAAATLLVAISLIFFAARVLPGDPVAVNFGQHPDKEKIEQLREELGLNKPVYEQLFSYFYGLVTRGDLGRSLIGTNKPVSEEILRHLPATLELTTAAMLIALPAGVLMGVAAAVWRRWPPDYLCTIVSLLGVSVPVFFLAICLRDVFTSMPVSGRLPSHSTFELTTQFVLIDTLVAGRFDLFLAGLQHLCLPALALSTIPMAIISRITRSSMLEVLSADYVRTARAKGTSPWRVIWRHAFPNAAAPVANIAAFQIGVLLSGAVLTETVFDWQGLGQWVTTAVINKDFPAVQGGAMVIAATIIAANLFVDLCYVWLDPRIRLE